MGPRKKKKLDYQLSLSSGQYKIASEIAGNVAVAWFAAGVVAPVFVSGHYEGVFNFIFTIFVGLFMAGVFIGFALQLAKRIK